MKVLKFIEGTFIEEIFEVIESGEFHDSEVPIEDGETVVLKMNILEKALYSICHKYDGVENWIENKDCYRKYEIAREFLWQNIEKRMAENGLDTNSLLQVRQGHNVVYLRKDDLRMSFLEFAEEWP